MKKHRLVTAMIAYAALAVLTLATISDHRVRAVTLAVLAMFAVKSWIRRKDFMHPDGEDQASDAGPRTSAE